LAKVLRAAARQYPIVTVTGPRQSGKTTLCRAVFPKKPYASFDALDVREFARAVRPRAPELLAGRSRRRLSELMSARRLSSRSFVVYGGDQAQNRTGVRVVPWNRIGSVR
jgi:predicted AAA+ superfamily ATPase